MSRRAAEKIKGWGGGFIGWAGYPSGVRWVSLRYPGRLCRVPDLAILQ